ncbi:YwiC-like family protein [Streptomyces sp. NPDC050439]|uniref:YwiC-like family protein n=1 Tax=unclassified Streptomyces TaxID=2593676 RepID=UPI0034128FB6
MASRAVRRWLPNQHGAWAMLVVPFLTGMFLGAPTPWHAVLLLAWLLGYLATFHVQQWLRLRRHSRNPRAAQRHALPAQVFLLALLPLAVALVVHAPWLLAAGACAVPFLAVNCAYAWRNRERALPNGIAAVIPACGMLPVALLMGGGDLGHAWRPTLACLLYFAGTVLYVKTMIRERGSSPYRWASAVWHAGAVAVTFGIHMPVTLVVFFGVCFLRAVWMPTRGRVRAPVVGALEMALSLALLGALVATYGG